MNKKSISFEQYFNADEKKYIKALMETSLDEDIGSGDVTTQATIPSKTVATGRLLAKQEGVVCGLSLISIIFKLRTRKAQIKLLAKDGDFIKPGMVLAEITSPAAALLEVERVVLNYIQRLSGIATLTRQYVDLVKDTHAAILDTRKTTPLLRFLEKYAVACGGGTNHRFGLYDQVLIKDNHIDVAGGIDEAIRRVRNKSPEMMIEVEARTFDEVKRAVQMLPDIILLDNMTTSEMKKCVQYVDGRCQLEASGGVNLKTVHKIALTGVNRISIGALTHSAPSVDLSLKVVMKPVKNG